MRLLAKLRRSPVAATHDIAMAALSFPLALYLRLGSRFAAYAADYLVAAEFAFIMLFAAVALGFKLHRSVWRYVSIRELLTIGRVVLVCITGFYLLMFLSMRLEGIPRSLPFIHAMLLGILLAGPRLLYRIWRTRAVGLQALHGGGVAVPVLLVGYQDSAEQFVRGLQRTAGALYRVVGLMDDDTSSHGRMVHGVPILGGIADLKRVVEKLEERGEKPQRVILSEDYLEPQIVAALLEQCEALGLSLARLPKLTDFREGVAAGEAAAPRPIAIEDILGRAQHAHDRAAMRALIAGKTVLVTGAGGTIGGELTRQAAGFGPKKLLLLEASEYNLYRIDLELAEHAPEVERIPLLVDVRDAAALDHVMQRYTPDLVFHAAAIKHVPLAESNVTAAVETNVFGTRNVADAAARAGVATMLMISTDKAVNPTNIMGATKRLAEQYILAKAAASPQMRFVTVRFGNVLGSTGSVVPLFQRQIAAGGPVTVTHPDIERFFMTVREAVELVISAAALAQKVENPGIFILDMGTPVKIRDLARQMIRLAGLRPEVDIKIEYTGLRPGEKLYEELAYAGEEMEPTASAGIRLARTSIPSLPALEAGLKALYEACRNQEAAAAARTLGELVPEYKASS